MNMIMNRLSSIPVLECVPWCVHTAVSGFIHGLSVKRVTACVY
jgi:hypothetical protein